MIIKQLALAAVLVSVGSLAACNAHKPQPTPHFFVDQRYIDLKPGWRIKVVTPIVKGGGYKVQTEEVRTSTGSVEMRTSAAFIGYEIDYYAVESTGNRIAIRFLSAETRTNGTKRTKGNEPLVSLFSLPVETRNVRLLFLTRVSQAEHNAAILSASSAEALNKLTNLVETNPAQNCRNETDATCFWVPEGISVQPEKKDPANPKQWIPAA